MPRQQRFAADISKFRNLTAQKMKAVAINSVQDVLGGAQTTARGVSVGGTLIEGRIPVASGDLVNSLSSSVGAVGTGSKGSASYVVALAGYELGDIMRFEWTMEYALRIELGYVGTDSAGRTFNQPGWHFVGYNAAQFSEHVDKNARLVGGIQ